jgi:hypothetical protein
VNLVGGSNPMEGNVFATNPRTNVYGPICAKAYWSTNTVDLFLEILILEKFKLIKCNAIRISN